MSLNRPAPEPAAVDPVQRSAWTRELARWWGFYNAYYLNDQLRPPSFEILDAAARLGSYDARTRRLGIAAHHIRRHRWAAVLETLRHEMAHQYAFEVLHCHDQVPHGPAFRQAAHRLRVDARAAGSGDEVTHHEPDSEDPDGVRRVIAKLLSLASSPNEHEAQAAMKKARQLLLKYNLDEAQCRRARAFEVRQLGALRRRRHDHEYLLGAILSRFFFVEVLWSDSYDATALQRGRLLEVYGSRVNVDMAEYVFGFLTGLLPRLWQQYRRDQGLAGNRDRLRYFSGVLEGLHAKLQEQERGFVEEMALLRQGDPELKAFFRYHNPRTSTARRGGVADTQAYHDGVARGRRVVIHKPLEQSRGAGGRQLDA